MQLLEDDKLFKSDVILLERAMRHGWEIPDKVLKDCPQQIIKILSSKGKGVGPRERLRAIEVLIKMRQQNLDQLPRTKTRQSFNRIIVNSSRQELLRDERYLEYCRNNPIDDDAGMSGEDVEQGEVGMGTPSETS